MQHNFISPFNHKIKINRINFNISKFPCKNYKIAHISDIHIGYYLEREFLEDLVDKIVELNPNICVITGDLIAYNLGMKMEALSPLKRLSREMETYFVLGNHEIELYGFKIDLFLTNLQKMGIHTLHNQSTTVKTQGCKFNLVGIGEKVGKYYNCPIDIESSFKNIDDNLETIVLVHRPYTIKLMEDYPFILALSGHNHGGQLTKLGFLTSVIRGEWKYLNGKIKLGKDKYIYITSGVGYSRVPIRIFAPSEIALIEFL